MLSAQSPLPAASIRPKSGRRPLRPLNATASSASVDRPNPKPKPECSLISLAAGDSNKENRLAAISAPPKRIGFGSELFTVEAIDASLGEELSVVREKLDRMRKDRERTEEMLRERDSLLDLQMKEIRSRGEVQKQLEIEVDRLYRLNQLRSSCMRISPIRSLREKQQLERKIEAEQLQENEGDLEDECSSQGAVLEICKSEMKDESPLSNKISEEE